MYLLENSAMINLSYLQLSSWLLLFSNVQTVVGISSTAPDLELKSDCLVVYVSDSLV